MVPLQLCGGLTQFPAPRFIERIQLWQLGLSIYSPSSHQCLGEVSCSRNMSCGFAIWVILRDNGAGKSSNRCSCQMITLSHLQKKHLLASQLCRLSLNLTLPDKFQPFLKPPLNAPNHPRLLQKYLDTPSLSRYDNVPGVWVVLVALIWLLYCSQLLFSWMVLNIQSLGLHSWALSSVAEADHSAKPDCWLGLTRSFPIESFC